MRVLLVVSGSVAAYKAAALARLLRRRGAAAQVALTAAARRLVGAATFRALTGEPTLEDEWRAPHSADGMDHIAAVRAADVLVVAPASADFIAKAAAGIADNLALSAYLATTTPKIVAPAMNKQMWAAAATQRNIAQLQADGAQILFPAAGEQACGEYGDGRMQEPEDIADAIFSLLNGGAAPQRTVGDERTADAMTRTSFGSSGGAGAGENAASDDAVESGGRGAVVGRESESGRDVGDSADKGESKAVRRRFLGKRVVVSVGATAEPLDAMRIISNRSSGYMGFCLAREAKRMGAEVRIVAGLTTAPPPPDIALRRAVSGAEMREAVFDEVSRADWFFSAAAVADFAAANADGKPSREAGEWRLRLRPTPDILAQTRQKYPQVAYLGFAAQAETDSAAARSAAREKMRRKGIAYLAVNHVGDAGGDDCQLTLLYGGGERYLPRLPKPQAAARLLSLLSCLSDVSCET